MSFRTIIVFAGHWDFAVSSNETRSVARNGAGAIARRTAPAAVRAATSAIEARSDEWFGPTVQTSIRVIFNVMTSLIRDTAV